MLAVTLTCMENDAQAITADWLRLLAAELGEDSVDAQAVIKFGASPLVSTWTDVLSGSRHVRRRAVEVE